MSRTWFACAVALAAVIGPQPADAETLVVFSKSRSSPIYVALRGGANVAGKTLGGVVVNHYMPSIADNIEQQAGLVDEAIKSKADAIIFTPVDVNALAPWVKKINDAGIPLVNVVDRIAGGTAIAFVGVDDYDLGLNTARTLLKAIGGKGNVVILEGPPTIPTAAQRAKGFEAALKEFPEVKLLASKPASYARTEGASITQGLLRQFPQIDGILAANDPMAMGAIESLKSAKRKAQVVGINAAKEVMELIKSGDMLASGDYSGFSIGCIATEIAVRHLRKQEIPKEVILKPTVVDKSNLAPYEMPFDKRECPTLASVPGK